MPFRFTFWNRLVTNHKGHLITFIMTHEWQHIKTAQHRFIPLTIKQSGVSWNLTVSLLETFYFAGLTFQITQLKSPGPLCMHAGCKCLGNLPVRGHMGEADTVLVTSAAVWKQHCSLSRHRHGHELGCISQGRSSCPGPHSSGKDFSLVHMVHNHGTPESLPVTVQSPSVAGLVGLGKISHPYALCEKSHVDLKPGIMRFGGIPADQRSQSSSSWHYTQPFTNSNGLKLLYLISQSNIASIKLFHECTARIKA